MMRFRSRQLRRSYRRAARNVPFFPLIPLVPAAIFFSSVITSLRALVRVRRLERRLAT